MSQQDSDANGDISPSSPTSSDSDGSISPSSSISSDDPWNCHHMGHLEAIPINRGGILKIVRLACIDWVGREWRVRNPNDYGANVDICFKIPGPGNNWIASISEPKAMDELRGIVRSNDTKSYKYHWYSTTLQRGDIVSQEFIIESYLEGDKKERVPEGSEMIETLQERLRFMPMEERDSGPYR